MAYNQMWKNWIDYDFFCWNCWIDHVVCLPRQMCIYRIKAKYVSNGKCTHMRIFQLLPNCVNILNNFEQFGCHNLVFFFHQELLFKMNSECDCWRKCHIRTMACCSWIQCLVTLFVSGICLSAHAGEKALNENQICFHERWIWFWKWNVGSADDNT